MHPTTVTFSRDLIPRLSRLHLVTDPSNPASPLAHIHLRVTPERIRFAATNGRLLAVMTTATDDHQGDMRDVILTVHQFNDALKAVDRVLPSRGHHRVTITINATEATFSAGNAAALVRLHPGAYPNSDHVFTRTVGQRWMPSLSSLSPLLTAVAQKVAGKIPLLFSSPITPSSSVAHWWGAQSAGDHAAQVSLTDVRAFIQAPAYWCDDQLAFLLMPITRKDDERPLELTRFVRSMSASNAVESAVAAAA